MPLTPFIATGLRKARGDQPEAAQMLVFNRANQMPSVGSKCAPQTTLDMLFVGGRVCVRGRPQTCGEIVRLMPMTGRVVVRLDPPHPSWRGTLRSFRPESLVIFP
jgi:hypothetical protein